ncbi:hypothetical protein MASR1M50_01120 [Burkholderiales bacterium]
MSRRLAALKIGTNPKGAIKAMRATASKKAMGKDGTPEAIHAELLKRLKVPTTTQKSGDPIQDEPLMEGLGIDWEKEKLIQALAVEASAFSEVHQESKEKEIHASMAYWRKVNPKLREQGRIDQLGQPNSRLGLSAQI